MIELPLSLPQVVTAALRLEDDLDVGAGRRDLRLRRDSNGLSDAGGDGAHAWHLAVDKAGGDRTLTGLGPLPNLGPARARRHHLPVHDRSLLRRAVVAVASPHDRHPVVAHHRFGAAAAAHGAPAAPAAAAVAPRATIVANPTYGVVWWVCLVQVLIVGHRGGWQLALLDRLSRGGRWWREWWWRWRR